MNVIFVVVLALLAAVPVIGAITLRPPPDPWTHPGYRAWKEKAVRALEQQARTGLADDFDD